MNNQINDYHEWDPCTSDYVNEFHRLYKLLDSRAEVIKALEEDVFRKTVTLYLVTILSLMVILFNLL